MTLPFIIIVIISAFLFWISLRKSFFSIGSDILDVVEDIKEILNK